MSAEAFGETLQFITNVKLEELEKRRQKYSDHLARVLAKAGEINDSDLIARLVVLIDGMKIDRKSTRLNSSHSGESRMPSSA